MSNLKYEMGYTPKEFKRTLHGLFITQTPYSCEERGDNYWQMSVEGETTLVDIKINEAPPRKIVTISLPVLDVEFEFEHATEDQQKDFMKRFFRFFHKGGG